MLLMYWENILFFIGNPSKMIMEYISFFCCFFFPENRNPLIHIKNIIININPFAKVRHVMYD